MQTKIHEPTQIVEVMLTHVEQADEFTELLTRERRIQDNLALLQWAFVGMVEMIKARMELSSSDEHALNEKFWRRFTDLSASRLRNSAGFNQSSRNEILLSSSAKQSTATSLICAAKRRTSSSVMASSGRRRRVSSNRSASSRLRLSSLSAIRTAIRTTLAERLPTI